LIFEHVPVGLKFGFNTVAARFDGHSDAKPVFISYARKTNSVPAMALYKALGGEHGPAFLDLELIAQGDEFPSTLTNAILNCRVFVLFADDLYFQRWVCLRELQTALAPFETRLGAVAEGSHREAALRHIVVTLPGGGSADCMENLPAALRAHNWPSSIETGALVALVHRRLVECPSTIDELLTGTDSERLREVLRSEAALPPPRPLPRPHYPATFPPSLNQRFVGRADDLFRIHFACATLRGEPTRTAALSGALEGGGGFGKTCLAPEYAWRFASVHYPGGVFWLTADQDESGLERQMKGMLAALRGQTGSGNGGENVRAEPAAALEDAAGTGRPVLYIVDNLPEPKAGVEARPIEHYCPAVGAVTVLATTRAPAGDACSLPLDRRPAPRGFRIPVGRRHQCSFEPARTRVGRDRRLGGRPAFGTRGLEQLAQTSCCSSCRASRQMPIGKRDQGTVTSDECATGPGCARCSSRGHLGAGGLV